jgi:hypothetical protein
MTVVATTYKTVTDKPLHFFNLTAKTMIYQFFYLINNKSIHILNSLHERVPEVFNDGAQMLQYIFL